MQEGASTAQEGGGQYQLYIFLAQSIYRGKVLIGYQASALYPKNQINLPLSDKEEARYGTR